MAKLVLEIVPLFDFTPERLVVLPQMTKNISILRLIELFPETMLIKHQSQPAATLGIRKPL